MQIAIYGAGSTGCYLGGLFLLCGHDVSLICRPRVQTAIESHGGITLTDYEGQHETVMPTALITSLADYLADHDASRFDAVFVTLKCHQLNSAKEDLIRLAESGSELFFMQNGLGSLDVIIGSLPPQQVKQGITPFNVLSKADATYHRGTAGDLVFEQSDISMQLKPQLEAIGFACKLHADMRPVIYAKLLLNLNNALNAISDLPIKTQMEDRAIRRVLAEAMTEWLAVAKAEGVTLEKNTAVPAAWIPHIIKLPTFLFTRVAQAMIAIDPEARSSMWEDIQAGRPTEIRYLNGAVARKAATLGLNAPVNKRISELVSQLEAGQRVTLDELSNLV